MKIKKLSQTILSFCLALILAIGTPLYIYAANTTKYISEVVTYCASSFDDAKKGLEALGYIIVENSNLNSTLETGVYLGYKTTENKSEAITDIAAMNMTGEYSYTDYETILNNQRDEIKAKLDEIVPAIKAYQDSYEEHNVSGEIAYLTLNQYYEDDSNQKMGDLLLSYDFSDEKEDELAEIFLQGSSPVILNMLGTLALTAGKCDGTSILDDMAYYGLGGVYDYYLSENGKNGAIALKQMNEELSQRVILIQNDWDNLYETLCDAEKYLSFNNDEVTLNLPEISDEIDSVDLATIMEEINLYLKLMNTKVDENMTALEYFKRPFSNSFLSDLYLLAYCMTDAQAGLLNFLSLSRLLSMDIYELDDGNNAAEEVLNEYEKSTCTFISVYDGIDRTYFEDGVAFTSEATKHESLTGDSWCAEGTSISWLTSVIATSALTLACAGAGVGILAYVKSIHNAYYLPKLASAKQCLSNARAEYYACTQTLSEVTELYEESVNTAKYISWGMEGDLEAALATEKQLQEELRIAQKSKDLAFENTIKNQGEYNRLKYDFDKGIGRGFKVFTCVMFVVAIVCLILDVISIYLYFSSTEEVKEEDIPLHLVTAIADGEGNTDYVYYNTVNDVKGNPADVNNHEGSKNIGWLVLYYTKDPLAGSPITEKNFKVQTGSTSVSETTYGIHMFNENSPINLTDKQYTGKTDTANGTYVLFERANSLAVGTSFGNGSEIMYLGLGVILGIAVSLLLSRAEKKSKKDQIA